MADSNITQSDDDRLIDEMANFGPAFDDETMQQLEKSSSTKERGVQRRLCLIACASSAETLSDMSIKEPDAFGEMLELVEVFAIHAKAVYEMADTALLRMKIADCRQVAA